MYLRSVSFFNIISNYMPRNIKARCIIRHGEMILLCRCFDEASNQTYYILPGGTVESGEDPKETIKREIQEELGSSVENLSFIQEVENDYEESGVLVEQRIHLFQADLKEKTLYEKQTIDVLDRTGEVAEWVSVSDIAHPSLILHPECVKDIVCNLQSN
jgi:ADP-ribose pyrophosphatase YjhB (NUDIX family)